MKNLFQKKKCKLNNKGVTLVEIVIAMAILAVVVVPFVHSFVTAANTNRKSRETLNGTTIAEDLMELYEDVNVEKEVEDINYKLSHDFSGVADAGSVSEEDGIITINMGSSLLSSFLGESFVNDGYTADIVLNPRTANEKDKDGNDIPGAYKKYNVVNSNLADLGDMDSRYYGIFSISKSYDDSGIEALSEKSGVEESLVKANVKRTIKVDLRDNRYHVSGVQFVKVIVTVEYQYGSYSETVVQKTVYDNTVSDSQPAYDFKGFYLIYTPMYINKPSTGNTNDEIYIYNDDNIKCDMYILHTSSSGDEAYFENYKVPITVRENKADSNVILGYETSTSIRTNLYKEYKGTSDPDGYFKYLLDDYDDTKYLLGYAHNPSVTNTPVTNQEICNNILDVRGADGRYIFAGNVKNVNRIYSMTVTVYRNGRKLVELTGTKLNKTE